MEQKNKLDSIECDTPVTIVIKRRPKPERIDEFEEVMAGTSSEAMTFKGHLGANILRPAQAGDYYRIVFKFDSMRNYIAWESSEARQRWMQRYDDVMLGEHEQEILSGLETWFTLEGEEALVPPPKHKMMVVVWISIFPLSLFFNYCLKPFISELPIIVQVAVTSGVIVILMTYVAMPTMAKLFHRWLYSG